MFGRKSDQQKIQAQEELLAQAKQYIEQMQRAQRGQQEMVDAWEGGKRFMLSHLEGAWEVPVRMAESPTGTNIVATLQPIRDEDSGESAPSLLCFSLQSAFAERARLEDLSSSGWALVRAWPANLPGGIESLPGYNNDRYVVCALTSIGLWEAGQQSEVTSSLRPTKSSSGFEFRA